DMILSKIRISTATASMLKESAANRRTLPALSGRNFSQQYALPFVAVACALLAMLISGVNLGRPAHAAATQQVTAQPTPDYSNVDDILNGRRQLLRDDDFVILEDTNDSGNGNQVSYKILQTTAGQIASELPINGVSTPLHDAQLTQVGRMWDSATDAGVSVFTHSNPDLKIFEADAYSPTTKSAIRFSLWEHTSLPTSEPLKKPLQAILVSAMKMADFNQDGFDDLVINYGQNGGDENAIQIVNATDVNNFASGLTARGENVLTSKISQDGMV